MESKEDKDCLMIKKGQPAETQLMEVKPEEEMKSQKTCGKCGRARGTEVKGRAGGKEFIVVGGGKEG